MEELTACLAWATKKRHIAVNGKILCEPSRKTTGYCGENGQYNTLSLSGLPTYEKKEDDVKFSHSDGFIEFKPLSDQKVKIDTSSVCSKCARKYKRLIKNSIGNK